MKIKLKFSIVLIICLFSFILKGERINNYEVIVQINKDRSVTVNEVIYYDMDSTEKHGIYRYIPLKAKEGRKKEFLSMNYIRRNGKPEYYKGERYEDGMAYRIGSPKKFLDRKVHRYEIDYTLFNAINEQDKIYQLYFNVIPQFWEVPIEKVDITIKISKNGIIERKEIEDLKVYTGKTGERGNNYEILSEEKIIRIRNREFFPENSGMTVQLILRTDKLQITSIEKLKMLYYENPIVILGPVILFFLIIYGVVTWLIAGRDPHKRVIVPEFNIPENISPIEAAYINGERREERILNIGIISLMSKGYITTENKNGKSVKYVQNSIKNGMEKDYGLKEDEKKILSSLDMGGDILKNAPCLYGVVSDILRNLKKDYEKNIFIDNRKYVFPFQYGLTIIIFLSIISREGGMALGIFETAAFFLICLIFNMICLWVTGILDSVVKRKAVYRIFLTGIVLLMSYVNGVMSFWITSAAYILLFIYQKIIGRYTEEGLRKKEYLDGMKMYIKTAEENMIKKFSDIDELALYFKEILPFTLALGVKNEAMGLMEKSAVLSGFGEKIKDTVQEMDISYSNSQKLSDLGYKNYRKKKVESYSHSYPRKTAGISGSRHESKDEFSGGGSGGGGGSSW